MEEEEGGLFIAINNIRQCMLTIEENEKLKSEKKKGKGEIMVPKQQLDYRKCANGDNIRILEGL